MVEKTRGIILRSHSYGESDLILKVLTSSGKLESFLAKSAKKSKKRFTGGVLEPLRYVDFVYKVKTSSDLFFLNEARIVKSFDGIRKTYDNLEMAFEIVKKIEKLGNIAADIGVETFNLLGNTLNALSGECELGLFKLVFFSKLLHIHGVLPEDWSESNLVTYPIQNHKQINLEPDQVYRLQRKVDYYLQELF